MRIFTAAIKVNTVNNSEIKKQFVQNHNQFIVPDYREKIISNLAAILKFEIPVPK